MVEPFTEFERINIANALHNLQTTAEAWGNEQCSLSMEEVLSSGREVESCQSDQGSLHF